MSAAAKPIRVLVVEDELIIAMDLQLRLRDLGCTPVGHATRGEQAVKLAEALRPDLVMMDIQLAGAMDGITAAQEIRSRFDIPAVFLSAFTGPKSHERAGLCNPAGYLGKPFADHELR